MSKSSSSLTRGCRPPPKLQREVRIPILKIEKLRQNLSIPKKSTKANYLNDDDETLEQSEISPGFTSPPQLEIFLNEDAVDDDSEVFENEKTKESSISKKGSSSMSQTSGSEQKEVISEAKRQRISSSKSNEPRKIIQSIFAKPKQLKPRRSRRAKGKAASKKTKPALKMQGGPVLKIKIAPAGSRGFRKVADQEDSQVDEKCNEMTDEPAQDSSHLENIDEEDTMIKDKDEQITDDDDKSSCGGSILGHVNEAIHEDDDNISSRRSDEDDDIFNAEVDQEEDWKPVRAAMVAAMELVAKKQVTEDMRIERRVRKHNVKPLPPKGRGRRTIFKKASKPVQSCWETAGPSVVSSMFYNKVYHQKGDIVVLSADLNEENPNPIRYFQVRGFLRNPMADDCASLLCLERKYDCGSYNDVTENFNPSDYKPMSYSPTGEIMVEMKDITQVMHCPFDFYHGHDLTYRKPVPGATFIRLGCPLFHYEISSTPKESQSASVKGDESDTTSSTTSKS